LVASIDAPQQSVRGRSESNELWQRDWRREARQGEKISRPPGPSALVGVLTKEERGGEIGGVIGEKNTFKETTIIVRSQAKKKKGS